MHVGKTLIDLLILGCELHQNAFGGRARIRWGAKFLPTPPSH